MVRHHDDAHPEMSPLQPQHPDTSDSEQAREPRDRDEQRRLDELLQSQRRMEDIGVEISHALMDGDHEATGLHGVSLKGGKEAEFSGEAVADDQSLQENIRGNAESILEHSSKQDAPLNLSSTIDRPEYGRRVAFAQGLQERLTRATDISTSPWFSETGGRQYEYHEMIDADSDVSWGGASNSFIGGLSMSSRTSLGSVQFISGAPD